jgi:hypothetical protein
LDLLSKDALETIFKRLGWLFWSESGELIIYVWSKSSELNIYVVQYPADEIRTLMFDLIFTFQTFSQIV